MSSWRDRLVAIWPGMLASLIVVLYALSMGLTPERADNDVWWHLKTGEYITENGLPEYDPFAYTAEHHEWHNHEWLTEIAMWRIYQFGEDTTLGGFRTVILVKALIIAAYGWLLLFLSRRISRSWWIALLVALVCVAVGRRTFYPRPPVLSNLLIAGELLLLIGAQEGWWRRRWLWALPPVFALWTNMHGGWIAGGVILAAFLGTNFLWDVLGKYGFVGVTRLFRRPVDPIDWRLCVGVGLACLAATLLNPYGWRLYELPFRVMSNKDLVNAIGELQPPVWSFMTILIPTLVALPLLLLNAFLMRDRELRPGLAELAIAAFFCHQGVNHVRHLLLFGVALAPLFSGLLLAARMRFARLPHNWGSLLGPGLLTTGIVYAIIAGLTNLPDSQSYPFRNRQYLAHQEGYIRGNYPADLADFIELVGFEGRMFNQNFYAGYLLWRFSPEQHKVFSDPRFDIFGGEIWTQEELIAGGWEEPGYPTWRQLLDFWDVQWAIVPKTEHAGKPTRLYARLSEKRSGWKVVSGFWIGQTFHMIWVRDTPENQDLITRARRMDGEFYRSKGWIR